MTVDPSQLLGLAGAPIILAIVQLIKGTFPMTDSRLWPVVTLAIAIGWNLALSYYLHADLVIGAILGLVTGLSASGLYSHATNLGGPGNLTLGKTPTARLDLIPPPGPPAMPPSAA